MSNSYTQNINDLILDLPDLQIAAVWEDIESTPTDTTADLWRKKLEKIARENSFSSRFALMRILYGRAKNISFSHVSETDIPSDADAFTVCVCEKVYCFQDISIEHANTLTPREHLDYTSCLKEMASCMADYDPDVTEQLISRAWYDVDSANMVAESLLSEEIKADKNLLKSKLTDIRKENSKKYREQFSRKEALQLGHLLGFSLEEIQWYLLRVFDVAEGFCYNLSRDLIEVYGFLTGATWQNVERLQEEYAQKSTGIEKLDSPERNSQWTKNISDTLPGKIGCWLHYPETMDNAFMEWMLSKAPGLDVPSRTTLRIYRNLASFAHDLITNHEVTPTDPEFADCIRDVYQEEKESGTTQRLLYEKDTAVPSDALCKAVADKLILENSIQSATIQTDNTKAWHVLTRLQNGSLSAAGGIVNSSRSRVADILSGKVQAEKGDLLYLFWFVSNLIWTQSTPVTDEIRSYRLMDFMDLSIELLEEAMLPTFYPPHIMEQSMLLSIVCGGKLDNEDPSVVYEYMLHTLVRHRNRKKSTEKK